MTNEAKSLFCPYRLLCILLIALLFSSTYNASAVSYSLPKTRTPTPTISPYPPAETPTFPTPDTLQSYKVFLPLVEAELLYTQSYYMTTVDSIILKNLGCRLGQRDSALPGIQNSVIILDFGYPRYKDNEYGTIIFGSLVFVSTTEIGNAVIDFSTGYHQCLNELSYLTIAIGTNNCGPGYCTDSAVTQQHGNAWALMVNGVNDSLEVEEYFEILAMGASDIEIAWNDKETTRNWVNGYNEVNQFLFYNFGDAQGCPFEPTNSNSLCDNYWYQEDVWYVSFGAEASKPLPLIYATSGVNADQWYSLSAYAHDMHGERMDIKGSVTQYQACIQDGFTWCQEHYVNNTPSQGYTQLWNALNADPDTTQNLLWATDMAWQE